VEVIKQIWIFFSILRLFDSPYRLFHLFHLVCSFVSGKALVVGVKSDSVAAEDVSVHDIQIVYFHCILNLIIELPMQICHDKKVNGSPTFNCLKSLFPKLVNSLMIHN
jgi:hypothetical protein